MCEFCGSVACTLTKQQAMERGPILERYANGFMRNETDETPQTYCFEGVPPYNSYSALFPGEREENPHAYIRFVFDEDEGTADGWECWEIEDPLAWITEQEVIAKFEKGDR